MTAIAEPSIYSTPTAPRGRITNVVRLQFLNLWTFVWTPLCVLGGSWLISLLINAIINSANVSEDKVSYGAQAPLWYFLVVGVMAMAYTFPFSQAMTITRREFFLGTLGAAAISSVGMSLIFVAFGLIEQATDGYGINAYFGYLEPLWVSGPLAAGFEFFVFSMLVFIFGFWTATVYRFGGAKVLTALLFALGFALVGLGALITWQEWWPSVGRWFVDTGALGLAFWGLGAAAVFLAISYATLRRLPA